MIYKIKLNKLPIGSKLLTILLKVPLRENALIPKKMNRKKRIIINIITHKINVRNPYETPSYSKLILLLFL